MKIDIGNMTVSASSYTGEMMVIRTCYEGTREVILEPGDVRNIYEELHKYYTSTDEETIEVNPDAKTTITNDTFKLEPTRALINNLSNHLIWCIDRTIENEVFKQEVLQRFSVVFEDLMSNL